MGTSWIVSYLKTAIPKMVKLNTTGQPWQRARFRKAWDFCVCVVGFDDPEDIGGSPGVKRAVHVQYTGKMMLKRKETWKVHMIVRIKIATLVTDSVLTDVEKAVVGYCLFQRRGRGRSLDGQRITALDFDDWTDHDKVEDVAGFIEVSALSITTAKSKELKRIFYLPLAL